MELGKRIWEKFLKLPGIKNIFALKFFQVGIGQKLINYETVSYIFFGVLTTIVNYVAFAVLESPLGWLIANTIAWVAGVLFAYVTNKLFVFDSKTVEAGALAKEFILFVLARVASLLFETAFMYLFVDLLSLNALVCKIIAAVGVVVMNYIFSKLFIFIKPKN